VEWVQLVLESLVIGFCEHGAGYCSCLFNELHYLLLTGILCKETDTI